MCISDPSYSIMLNGSPHSYFPGAKGLKQGDPLSPYLFVLIMEVLGALLLRRLENRSFKPHAKCRRMKIAHVGFIHDVLIFCKGEAQSVQVVVHIILTLQACSSTKIRLP